MKFRPCIDIHNGKVKQIVGGSLIDTGNQAKENFISEQDASFYAEMYKKDNITGGHIILLNSSSSSYYQEDVKQAVKALERYPNHLQIGGGITAENANYFLEHGAQKVIVTSYVFQDGRINFKNLEKLCQNTCKNQKKNLVLDLSCRKKGKDYYIVTNRWQKFTDTNISFETLDILAEYCDEFLIHAVDVEGKTQGIEKELVELLGKWEGIPITYAGGVGSFEDLDILRNLGQNKLDVTIGSALNIFGGTMPYQKVLEYLK